MNLLLNRCILCTRTHQQWLLWNWQVNNVPVNGCNKNTEATDVSRLMIHQDLKGTSNTRSRLYWVVELKSEGLSYEDDNKRRCNWCKKILGNRCNESLHTSYTTTVGTQVLCTTSSLVYDMHFLLAFQHFRPSLSLEKSGSTSSTQLHTCSCQFIIHWATWKKSWKNFGFNPRNVWVL